MRHEQAWTMGAAAAAAALIIGGAAAAGRAQDIPTNPVTVVGERRAGDGLSVRVSYRDLDLTRHEGERILNRRVGAATRIVCEPPDAPIGDENFSKCISFAWRGARPQIALATRRARDIAATGSSSIPLVAIAIVGRY